MGKDPVRFAPPRKPHAVLPHDPMSAHISRPEVPPQAEGSGVVGSLQAVLSRRRPAEAHEARDREIRALLEAALRRLQEGSP